MLFHLYQQLNPASQNTESSSGDWVSGESDGYSENTDERGRGDLVELVIDLYFLQLNLQSLGTNLKAMHCLYSVVSGHWIVVTDES